MTFQRRVQSLPWPAYLAITVVLFGALAVLFTWMFPEWPVSADVVLWVFFEVAAVATAVVVLRRREQLRSAGRFELQLAAGDALRCGRAPGDPMIRAELRRMVAEQRRQFDRLRWTLPAFGVWVLLWAARAADHPRQWVIVGWSAAVVLTASVLRPRQQRRLVALEQDLRFPP